MDRLSARRPVLQRDGRPVLAEIVVAVDQDRPVTIRADHLGEQLHAELGERDVHRALDMAGGELALRAGVEDQHVALAGGGGEPVPVDQPGEAIGPHLLDQAR